MNPQSLQAIGLTEPQAKAYILLIKSGSIEPPTVAETIGVTRTNAYKIFEQLEEMGLAKRSDSQKKLRFTAGHPLALEQLAEQKRRSALEHEQQVKAAMPSLLKYFFTYSEQPGVRYFQGKEDVKEIYYDQLRTNKPIYMIRPHYTTDLYDYGFVSSIRHLSRKAGIKRYAITPDVARIPTNHAEADAYMLLERTWIHEDDYVAPVEWCAYGDKVSIMSAGTEAMGMVIESAQIAESFRQLYELLQEGLRRRPDYDQLPSKAKGPKFVKKD